MNDEPAAARIETVLEGAQARMSWVNLGEVYYTEARRAGSNRAREAVDEMRNIAILEEPDAELTLSAAEVKIPGSISYADCFAVATAERHSARLLTADPEILALDRPNLEVIDLRSVKPDEESPEEEETPRN